MMKKILIAALFSSFAISCATKKVNSDNQETMYISSEQTDCTGMMPMKCMLIKSNLNDEWTYFYDKIEGFNYVPGFEYELVMTKTPIQNPAADQSSIKYQLVKVVKKIKKD